MIILIYGTTNHIYNKKNKQERCIHCKYKHSLPCEGPDYCSISKVPPFYNRLSREIITEKFRKKYLKYLKKMR